LRARLGAAVATVLALALLMVVGGARPAVVKAAVAYSGLGGPIAQSVRRGIDFDHDGFSPVLGGGDCDDLDASVHPGAREIPDDGIDQNCVGGDATTAARPVDDVGFVAPPASLPPDFDVVLITIDTLRADHLGTYGYGRDTSPRLDALAAEGALFVNGWAHAPSTRYSMPAILTGRLPLDVYYDYGVSGWPGILPKATTIAEILRDRGLHTGAVVNYHYFDPYRHMDQGIDPGDYDNSNARLHQGSDPAHTKGSSSREQTDHAIKWLDTLGGQRFFLWVHYYDPHHEYERHREVPQFGDAPMDLYDNEIRWTDSQIGRLFDDLKRRGVWDKTIVVVTGDHGEGFGEHDVTHHGYHLYAAQTKVPFIIKVPGQPPRRITTPVGHVDILPTLADLAGAAPSTEMMGRSLVDLLDGSAPPDRDRVIFQQLSYENHHEMRAAVDQRCHLIYNVSPHTSWEAYRIDVDPAEVHDVSDQPGPCDTVKAAFARWYDGDQIPPGAAEALLPARPTVARELDVDLGREVRLLGVALPAEIQAGATFDVTWTFEARGKLDDGWKVFAHFEQVGGRGRFTGDHEPARPFA
ncbi:MAG: sulfatase-like hydrolase/transferase, partial [Myxococcales bacterium]|nr:sulfatase-like hydrolase/transferase [Myxococcales bacterium]